MNEEIMELRRAIIQNLRYSVVYGSKTSERQMLNCTGSTPFPRRLIFSSTVYA